MDINDLRAASTLFMFLAFLGIVWFAVSRKRRAGFDEAAQLPFLGEPADAEPPAHPENKHE